MTATKGGCASTTDQVGDMKPRSRGIIGVTLVLALSACGLEAVPDPTAPPTTPGNQTQEVQDMWTLPLLGPVEPGTYFVDPDLDPSTRLRVVYDIPVEGWSQWAGAVKFGDDKGHVAVTITTVDNLVGEGCSDHSHSDPPVGSGVDDLATALADLAPFQVTSPPKDVTVYGYSGRYLELTVPDLPVEGSGDDRSFTGCSGGDLKSWVAPFDTEPGDAFYGYTGPGYTEEFWILDVGGIRLMIAAERSAGSPQEDLEELRAILDSIRIEP